MSGTEPRLIIAVDPGKVTGIATWADELFNSWQEPTWFAIDRIWNTLENAARTVSKPSAGGIEWRAPVGVQVEAIVCESFIITAATLRKTRGENWSLESIGALRWMSNRHSVEFSLQAPADAKRFMTDDKLRMMDWYRPSPGGHANDAARHLALYLARNDLPTFKRLMHVG